MTYESVKYSFTVTLKPHMYRLNPEIQYDHTNCECITILQRLHTKFTVIVELNQNFNVHMHGAIMFLKKSKNHMFDFKNAFRNSKYFGYVDIRQITDFGGWKDYLQKDLAKTRILVGRPSVLHDDFELFTIFDEFTVKCDISQEQNDILNAELSHNLDIHSRTKKN